MDPLDPIYLEHLFDDAMQRPQRVERVNRPGREHSGEEPDARRHGQRKFADELEDEAEDRSAGDRDGQPGDTSLDEDPELPDDEPEEVVDGEVVDDGSDPQDNTQPTVGREQDDHTDEDAVVVELDDPAFQPPVERRRPDGEGHIDFEV